MDIARLLRVRPAIITAWSQHVTFLGRQKNNVSFLTRKTTEHIANLRTVNRISKKSTFMSKKFDFTHNVRAFLQKFVKTFYLDRDLSCLIRCYCVHEIRWFKFCMLTFLFFGHVWGTCDNIIRFETTLIGKK